MSVDTPDIVHTPIPKKQLFDVEVAINKQLVGRVQLTSFTKETAIKEAMSLINFKANKSYDNNSTKEHSTVKN